MNKDRILGVFKGWNNPDAGGAEALERAEQAAIITGKPQKVDLPDGSAVEVKVDNWGRETGPFKTKKRE